MARRMDGHEDRLDEVNSEEMSANVWQTNPCSCINESSTIEQFCNNVDMSFLCCQMQSIQTILWQTHKHKYTLLNQLQLCRNDFDLMTFLD